VLDGDAEGPRRRACKGTGAKAGTLPRHLKSWGASCLAAPCLPPSNIRGRIESITAVGGSNNCSVFTHLFASWNKKIGFGACLLHLPFAFG